MPFGGVIERKYLKWTFDTFPRICGVTNALGNRKFIFYLYYEISGAIGIRKNKNTELVLLSSTSAVSSFLSLVVR